MKVESSTIAMKSEHSYYSHYEKKSASLLTTAEEAATLEFSEESKSLVEQLKDYKDEKEKQAKEQQKQNEKNMLMSLLEREKVNDSAGIPVKTPEDIQIETLKKILEMLNGMKGKKKLHRKDTIKVAENVKAQMNALRASAQSLTVSKSLNLSGGTMLSSGGNVTTWKKVTVESAFYTEAEHTAYTAQGLVKTADGREISFGVEVEMSRAFCEKYESCTVGDYVCVDPLVFNLEGTVGKISDQKFLFDLNTDGTEEEISFTEQGSGFLALDKNKDGKINDGNELFGTKSGDGFADLAEYDQDGNGWIDEADEVFQDLTIWTLNEEGEKVQLSLKDADVGAIYLGKASTEYSLKNEETHATNGVIRSTGVYLKESGGVGTVQHIDLAI